MQHRIRDAFLPRRLWRGRDHGHPDTRVLGEDHDSAVSGPQLWATRQAARGQIAIMFAFMVVVLLGMAGVAIDLAHVRSVAEDAEAAAQAGALAGVVYLPESSASTPAETTAISVAAANGFPVTSLTSVVPTAYSDTRRLKVTITTKVTVPFLHVLGLGTITVTRSAMASYSDPIETGAPDHVLGFAPYPTTGFNAVSGLTGYYPQGFYLQLKGPYNGLEHGDAYSTYFQTTSPDHLAAADGSTHTYVDPCTSAAAANGIPAPTYNNVCAQLAQPTAVPPAPTFTPVTSTILPNPYYNQNNAGDGQTGYNYIFTLPPNMPADGSHQVLLKVLDPLDECALDTTSAESTAIPTPTATFYNIVSSSSTYAQATGTSTVVLNSQDNLTDTEWQEISAGGSYYNLKNVATGNYLDVSGTIKSGATVVQDSLSGTTGSTSQQWTLNPSGGKYTIVNHSTDSTNGKALYLDVSGSSIVVTDGTGTGTTTQKWTLPTVSPTYQYEGQEAYYSGAFGSLSTSSWGTSSSTADYPTVYAALDGTGAAPDPTATPAALGAAPTLISEGSTRIDQCTSGYYAQDYPTTLEFQVFEPSLRSADNTNAVPAGSVNLSVSGADISVGTNPIYAGPEWQAKPTNSSCTGTCTLIGTHAFQWLTIGRAYNPSSVPVYIRVSVQSVVDSAYYSSNSEYGSNWSTKFGDAGNVFALGLCDISTAGVISHVGTQTNTDTESDPYPGATNDYGDIFQSADWEAADTSGLDPDKGCPDPNLDTAFTSGANPVVTTTAPIFRFQVNGRDGMSIITLTTASSGSVTDYIPLAELGPRFAGTTVTVRLFDAGDVTSANNFISILGPTDNPASSNFTSGNYTSTEYTSPVYPSGKSFESEPYHLDILTPANSGYSSAGVNRPPWWCGSSIGGTDYSADNPPAGRSSWCPPSSKNPIDQAVQVAQSPCTSPCTVANGFANNVWLEFQITLPSTYNPASGKDWWKVAYNLTGLTVGSSADDVTTWEIANSAAPVQLITAQ